MPTPQEFYYLTVYLKRAKSAVLALLKIERPQIESIAVDFSPTMLELVKSRFAEDKTVKIIEHNLDQPLPDLGLFDAVVSSFAIHHLTHERKLDLYTEIYQILTPGGIFCNLEHVSSSTPELHEHFLKAIDMEVAKDDPSNKLLDVETQLTWLKEIGFTHVDCYWKWLEMALLIGVKKNNSKKVEF
jgi:tRNA (cmo5U34)-methyltransferase